MKKLRNGTQVDYDNAVSRSTSISEAIRLARPQEAVIIIRKSSKVTRKDKLVEEIKKEIKVENIGTTLGRATDIPTASKELKYPTVLISRKRPIVKMEEMVDSKQGLTNGISKSSKAAKLSHPTEPKSNLEDKKAISKSCNVCIKSFKTCYGLHLHKKSAHGKSEPFEVDVTAIPELQPDINDPHCYCKLCDRAYTSRSYYRLHLKKVHKMEVPPVAHRDYHRPIRSFHLKPDVDDPTFFCRSCQYTYADRYIYHGHLRKLHNMKIPLKTEIIRNSKLKPDPSSPSFYCVVCKKTLSRRFGYLCHLKNSHKMEFNLPNAKKTIPSPNIIPDIHNQDGFCSSCDKKFTTTSSFRIHFERIHHLQVPSPKAIIHPELLPDKDDPDNYCKACERKFCTEFVYHQHLYKRHNIKIVSAATQINIIPDIHNQDGYCNSCDKKFSTSYWFRLHLGNIHQIHVPSPNAILHPELMPEINDPNHYCNACERKFCTKFVYHQHLNRRHDIKVVSAFPFKDPNVVPDLDDPNFHCKSCLKTYGSKAKYLAHLKNSHTIIAPSVRTVKIDPTKGVMMPNFDDPDFSCTVCKRSFCSKSSFHNHLLLIHQISETILPKKILRHHI